MLPVLLLAGLSGAVAAAPGEAPHRDRGYAIVGAPLLSYDSNLRTGVGAFGQLVVDDPTGSRPYRVSLSAQAYLTFGRYHDHYVRWDLPGLAGTKLRWDAQLGYRAWPNAPYFGVGNDTPRVEPEAAGATWYAWGSERESVRTNLRQGLGPSPWEVYGSALVAHQGVDVLPGTLLAAERPAGVAGGRLTQAGLGLFRDTRTDEIDPWDGSAVDLQVRVSDHALASDYDFVGVHGSWRGWLRPLPRFVLASRVLADARWGDEPFFTRAWLGGLARGVVGGRYLLRGLAEERLRGDGVVAAQGEIRWSFLQLTVLRTVDLRWMLVPFVDAARVWTWDEGADTRPDLHVTGGGGLRVNVKELLVLRGDVGFAQERYLAAPERRDQVQVYVLGEHPF